MVPDIDYYDEAYAIAETMPGLLNLTISGNVLDNDGVLAILDG
ncbi:F-box protein SKIP19-like, partial [Trifolium medium]|nr:F-box protein SKIP19-like [Trifolium medium]